MFETVEYTPFSILFHAIRKIWEFACGYGQICYPWLQVESLVNVMFYYMWAALVRHWGVSNVGCEGRWPSTYPYLQVIKIGHYSLWLWEVLFLIMYDADCRRFGAWPFYGAILTYSIALTEKTILWVSIGQVASSSIECLQICRTFAVLNFNYWVWLTRLYLLGLKLLNRLLYLPILKTVNEPIYLWKTYTKYGKNLFILIYLANESKSSLNLYSTIK